MSTQQPSVPAPTCPVKMSDDLPCGRQIYHAPGGGGSVHCIMHCRETTKHPVKFRQEIDAILAGTSADHRPKDRFDFTGFVFPEAYFDYATFTQDAYFSRATFTQNANFYDATFTQDANFYDATFTQDADFYDATFTQNDDFRDATFTRDANFDGATFTRDANFYGATFTRDANFYGSTFTQNANFRDATFTQNANFSRAKFTQNAYFSCATFTQDAYFSCATFTQDAYFSCATFTQNANFYGSTFTQNANFRDATFTQNADFRWTDFRRPELVRFYQVNQEEGAPGMRARLLNCRVEGVQFADVNWHRQGGRMVLQDELDLTDRTVREEVRPTHELVAIAYRQLVSNFEKERAYDLAEECKIGAMEMKRLDPKKFLFPKWLESYYKKWRWLRWLGENISVASLYRLTSRYGTSYTQALLVLFDLLVIFGLLFALPWFAIQREKPSLPLRGVWNRLGAGLFHSSVDVATRDSLYSVPTRFGHFASALETILVPAQLALFLLALRRRFRH